LDKNSTIKLLAYKKYLVDRYQEPKSPTKSTMENSLEKIKQVD